MVRAFVAVDISNEARAALAGVIERLKERGLSGVRWVRPEAIHLTLKFLGEIEDSQVEGCLSAMERAAPGTGALNLALSEIGAFPNFKSPSVIWVGVKGDLDPLQELQSRIDQGIYSTIGLPEEKREFSPHLTLGRVRENASGDEHRRIGEALAGVALDADVSWKVSKVNLIRSTLKPSGAVYDVLGSVQL